jgi:hypothetical protein
MTIGSFPKQRERMLFDAGFVLWLSGETHGGSQGRLLYPREQKLYKAVAESVVLLKVEPRWSKLRGDAPFSGFAAPRRVYSHKQCKVIKG